MNFYQFYQIMNESKIQQTEVDNQKILFFNYSPNVQFQSGIGIRDREYFKQLFENGRPSSAEVEEFIHSYAEGWYASVGSSLGSKLVAYADGKIVLGKAPYHSFLEYHPNESGPTKLEGYFNIKTKTLTVSDASVKLMFAMKNSFFKIETWNKILNNLLDAGLIDKQWKIVGCPPICSDEKDNASVGELLAQKSDIVPQEEMQKSKKEKEAEEMVRNFMTKKAIEDKNKDMMGYMYRYGDHTEH